MNRPPLPGPIPGAADLTQRPALSLRDIVEALCSSLPPAGGGLEMMLDRIERMP